MKGKKENIKFLHNIYFHASQKHAFNDTDFLKEVLS
jgi:hypothetical protein